VGHEAFRFRVYVAMLLAVLAIGTIGFAYTEKISFGDAFYFTVVTVATVGYGDISPHGGASKTLAVVLIVMGVGTFIAALASGTEMLVDRKQRELRKEKLNMMVGVFFSRVGSGLLGFIAGADTGVEAVRASVTVSGLWTDREFKAAGKNLKDRPYDIAMERIHLDELRTFLAERHELFLRLLENPNLLEHEVFTDLIRATLHLSEELLSRNELTGLPKTDIDHLGNDIKRAYGLLVTEWLEYMQYLKTNYPYLFSLAVRMNPFNERRSAIIQ
jgi:voltage-gated potassium channel